MTSCDLVHRKGGHIIYPKGDYIAESEDDHEKQGETWNIYSDGIDDKVRHQEKQRRHRGETK